MENTPEAATKILLKPDFETLWTLLEDRIYEVYNCFKDFYGEDFVDLQWDLSKDRFIKNLCNEEIHQVYDIFQQCNLCYDCPVIMVHFPDVKITNEFNKYVYIQDLYVQIPIDYNGRIKETFYLNRSTYTIDQFESRYIHSHVQRFDTDNLRYFRPPCLGSGPILRTVVSLRTSYNKDLWEMFCLELKKYVETESLEGVPYNKLENIGKPTGSSYTDNFKVEIFKESISREVLTIILPFLKHLIESNILKYSYKKNHYTIGIPYKECVLQISNLFIKWYNEQYNNQIFTQSFKNLVYKKLLEKAIIKNNRIYTHIPEKSTAPTNIDGKPLFTFKGNEVKLKIIDKNEKTDYSYILNSKIINFILTRILIIINCRYGKSEDKVNKKTRCI